MATCRKCHCTDGRAGPGGCYWVERDLCSSCVPLSELARRTSFDQPGAAALAARDLNRELPITGSFAMWLIVHGACCLALRHPQWDDVLVVEPLGERLRALFVLGARADRVHALGAVEAGAHDPASSGLPPESDRGHEPHRSRRGTTRGTTGDQKDSAALAGRGKVLTMQRNLERETGIEPAAIGLGSRCSTTELLPRDGREDTREAGLKPPGS